MGRIRKDNSVFIGVICIILIILYAWAGNRILHLTNQMFPMLNENTPNPVYDPLVAEIIYFGSFVWSVVVIVMGILWFKLTQLKIRKLEIKGTPEEKIERLTEIILEYESITGLEYDKLGFGADGYK